MEDAVVDTGGCPRVIAEQHLGRGGRNVDFDGRGAESPGDGGEQDDGCNATEIQAVKQFTTGCEAAAFAGLHVLDEEHGVAALVVDQLIHHVAREEDAEASRPAARFGADFHVAGRLVFGIADGGVR